jgi:hypothetical protein
MSGPILLVLRVALVAALYTFLGWALLTLWREIKRQNELLAYHRAPPITLLRHTPGELKSLRFSNAAVTIGRDPACDLPLAEKTVSANHARLSYHHGQWWVEDLHSRNGTFLNHTPVSEQMVLTSGDELRCGQVIFSLAIGESDLPELETSL